MSTDSKLRIAVCDDIQTDRTQIIRMTKQILQDEEILHSISGYEDAGTLLADIQNGTQFHILLLDVMMDKMSGMEFAAQLRKKQNKTNIIFISANRELALQGYEVSAVRYLAKPLDENKLKEALLYCYRTWRKKKEILLPTDQGKHRTSFADIQYVEAFDRGTRFVLANETLESRLKFNEVETLLPKSAFILCHRAYIVNLSCIKYIRPYEFSLKSGETVPIAKGRYSVIRKEFIDYIAD